MRLRIGVALWVLSWIPYGIILGVSGYWFTLVWTAELVLGLLGLALAGSEFAKLVKSSGWKRAPAIALRALLGGSESVGTNAEDQTGDNAAN